MNDSNHRRAYTAPPTHVHSRRARRSFSVRVSAMGERAYNNQAQEQVRRCQSGYSHESGRVTRVLDPSSKHAQNLHVGDAVGISGKYLAFADAGDDVIFRRAQWRLRERGVGCLVASCLPDKKPTKYQAGMHNKSPGSLPTSITPTGIAPAPWSGTPLQSHSLRRARAFS